MAKRPAPRTSAPDGTIARMGLRVGIDLVAVDTVREALDTHGDAYLRRVYTEREAADCAGNPLRLAARFAAKEATLKALRAGEAAVPLTDIEVRRAPSGAPSLALRGAAEALAADAGVLGAEVTLTHERAYAAAVVLLDTGEPTDQGLPADHR